MELSVTSGRITPRLLLCALALVSCRKAALTLESDISSEPSRLSAGLPGDAALLDLARSGTVINICSRALMDQTLLGSGQDAHHRLILDDAVAQELSTFSAAGLIEVAPGKYLDLIDAVVARPTARGRPLVNGEQRLCVAQARPTAVQSARIDELSDELGAQQRTVVQFSASLATRKTRQPGLPGSVEALAIFNEPTRYDVVLRRIDGRWRVTHKEVSVP